MFVYFPPQYLQWFPIPVSFDRLSLPQTAPAASSSTKLIVGENSKAVIHCLFPEGFPPVSRTIISPYDLAKTFKPITLNRDLQHPGHFDFLNSIHISLKTS